VSVHHGGNNILLISDLTSDIIIDSFYVEVATICFKEDTKILCLIDKKEKYIPIQNIQEDTYIKIYSQNYFDQYKKAKIIVKSSIFNTGNHSINKLYCLSKTKCPQLIEDLYVTGSHALLHNKLTKEQYEKMNKLETFFNNYKIHLENEEYMCDEEIKNKKQIMKYYNDYKITLLDKYKLIAYYDERFEELNTEKKYNIYHIVLENDNKYGNYGIYANGILAESTSEVSLLKFPNYERINTINTIKKTKEEPNAIEMKIKKYLKEKEKEKERKKETQLVKKMNEIENILIEEANNTNTNKNVTYKRMMKLYNSRENQSRKHSIRI
jgi:hypothetical protein